MPPWVARQQTILRQAGDVMSEAEVAAAMTAGHQAEADRCATGMVANNAPPPVTVQGPPYPPLAVTVVPPPPPTDVENAPFQP